MDYLIDGVLQDYSVLASMSLADHGINYHLSLTLLVITVELKHSRLAFFNDWNTVLILLNYLSLKIYPVTALKFSYHLSLVLQCF